MCSNIYNKKIYKIIWGIPALALLLLFAAMPAVAQNKAGTTIGNAPLIIDTTELEVQSGANYIRIEPKRLPATVRYLPEAPFGPIPAAMVMGDTLPAEVFFEDCLTGWIWTIPEGETTALIEVAAHEEAKIKVSPTVQTTINTIEETACDSFVYEGVKYTASGEYTLKTEKLPSGDNAVTVLALTIHNTQYEEVKIDQCYPYTAPSGKSYNATGHYVDTALLSTGCNRITTIDLTIDVESCYDADTVYFCRGFNTEHDDILAEGFIRRYRMYTFVSPSEWDFMEGVMVSSAHDGAMMDLRRAEANLNAFYTGGRTPIESIRWTVMYDGSNAYVPVVVESAPQWIPAGHLAVQIQFLCGEMYNTEFPMDIDLLQQTSLPVKRIENGRVVIIRGDAKYNVLGTKIKD